MDGGVGGVESVDLIEEVADGLVGRDGDSGEFVVV